MIFCKNLSKGIGTTCVERIFDKIDIPCVWAGVPEGIGRFWGISPILGENRRFLGGFGFE